jgi:hypothetical protein
MRYLLVGMLSVAALAQDPVAFVLGTPIHIPEWDGGSVTPDQWKALAAQIQLPLLEHYAKVHHLEPTSEEMAALRPLTVNPVTSQLSEELRARLRGSGLDQRAADEQVKAFVDKENQKTEAFVAGMVQFWKVGRALYRQYGGRVRLTGFGPEPFDAIERFLIEEERRGNFSVPDPQGRAAIWAVFVDKSGASRVVMGARADASYATAPWEDRH